EVRLRDIAFLTPPELEPWIKLKAPNFFVRGIQELAPGRSIAILWDSYLALTQAGTATPTAFDIVASDKSEGTDSTITDTFHIDLLDYWNTVVEQSDLDRHGDTLKDVLKELVKAVQKIGSAAEELTRMTDPTGLTVSITALDNFRRLISGREPPFAR